MFAVGGYVVQVTDAHHGSRSKNKLAQREDDGTGGDEETAGEFAGVEGFAEQRPGEQDDEDNAEFIDGGDFGSLAEREGAEVADPGEAGSEAGGGEKEPG